VDDRHVVCAVRPCTASRRLCLMLRPAGGSAMPPGLPRLRQIKRHPPTAIKPALGVGALCAIGWHALPPPKRPERAAAARRGPLPLRRRCADVQRSATRACVVRSIAACAGVRRIHGTAQRFSPLQRRFGSPPLIGARPSPPSTRPTALACPSMSGWMKPAPQPGCQPHGLRARPRGRSHTGDRRQRGGQLMQHGMVACG